MQRCWKNRTANGKVNRRQRWRLQIRREAIETHTKGWHKVERRENRGL